MYVTKGGEGEACTTGIKSYCQVGSPVWDDYYWAGTPPFCGSYRYKECAIGYVKILKDEYGDGSYCLSGAKALCVKRPF